MNSLAAPPLQDGPLLLSVLAQPDYSVPSAALAVVPNLNLVLIATNSSILLTVLVAPH
jgi:hypothetical protein